MDENLELITMKNGANSEPVSLAELAGLDLGGIDAKRPFTFPVGVFEWEVVADPEAPKLRNLGGKGAVVFNLKCNNVVAVKDPAEAPEGNPMELIGKIHRETFFITAMDSLGYLKAFIVDIGGAGKGALSDILTGTVGLKFTAPITHRADKDDKDRIYVNINRNKMQPEAKNEMG